MFDLIDALLPGATGSAIFQGGFALGAFGVALGLARSAALRLWVVAERRLIVRLTLDNRSVAYRHLYAWIAETGVLAGTRHVRVTELHEDGAEVYGPAPGRHWFWRDGRPCTFDRAISEKTQVGGGYRGGPMETVTITMLGGSMARLQSWVREGAAILSARARMGPSLHVLRNDGWDDLGPVPGRALATVIAEDDRVDRLAADMRHFLAAADWYAARGVPWRRGYLLYGPPGTGKSSVIRALATGSG
jgi:mitochondrial chaperone BCS1